MARKKKTSPLEDMMDLVALLPWWGGVAIAIAGYLVLHRMAAPVKVGTVQPGQVSQLMTASIITGLATVGQYLVPLVGLAGAAMSVVRRKQRAALISSVTQSQSANALDGMSWREFEMLVGEAYALQGYRDRNRRWRCRWRRRSDTGKGRRKVLCPMQAMESLQSWRGRGAGTVWRDGRQRGYWRICRDVWPVH